MLTDLYRLLPPEGVKILLVLFLAFLTGLEREDIETLSYSMYRICKVIEKFAERFSLAPQQLA